MYRKALSVLLLLHLILLACLVCVRGSGQNRLASVSAGRKELDKPVTVVKQEAGTLGIVGSAISKQRLVDVMELTRTSGQESVDARENRLVKNMQNESAYQLAEEELDILLRIVEAEAGNQDIEGRILVANVVLNRVESEKFPDNVTDVVLQKHNGKYQFSPVRNGRIWKVEISDETSEAVERALMGEDLSEGALYFAARKYADESSMKWFDNHLTFLFDHGGHEFYR